MKRRRTIKPIRFRDNEGNLKLIVPSNMTLEDMVACGLSVNIVPKDQPQKDGQLRAEPEGSE